MKANNLGFNAWDTVEALRERGVPSSDRDLQQASGIAAMQYQIVCRNVD
jgi:hypothetical protein